MNCAKISEADNALKIKHQTGRHNYKNMINKNIVTSDPFCLQFYVTKY